jgi:Rrf2 family protein
MAIIRRETDYALRAITRLALAGGFVPVSILSGQEDVPPDFLRKTMQRLNRAGVVESSRGPFGGYRLARPAGQVSFLDVTEAVQGPLVMNECITRPSICERVEHCPLRKLLSALGDDLNVGLAKVHISDVAEEAKSAQEVVK